jgi:hypothetical protein
VLRASEDRAPAVLRRSEQRRFSSLSDDEVGGSMRAMREQLKKEMQAAHKRKVLA